MADFLYLYLSWIPLEVFAQASIQQFLSLVLIAIACILMGAGLPTTALYIMYASAISHDRASAIATCKQARSSKCSERSWFLSIFSNESTIPEILRVVSTIANSTGASVTLMTVVEPIPVTVSQYLPKRYEKRLRKSTAAKLETVAASMDVEKGSVDSEVRFGSVYKEILTHAETIRADLIVMGSHEPNVADYLIGGNASRVVRHAACSVYIVRQRHAD